MDLRIKQMEQIALQNRVMTQVHRWYQFYERADQIVENQLDLLTDDIYVKSSLDESRGRDAYRTRLSKIPAGWKNAHHIQHVEVKQTDNIILLMMEIIYQNIGYLPERKMMNTPLRYHAKLGNYHSLLPKFFDVQIEQMDIEISHLYSEFRDAYALNRMKSLIHYWLTLFETPLSDATLFKEIFYKEINLHLSSARCANYDEFNSWFTKNTMPVLKSSHTINFFKVNEIDKNLYQLNMELEWSGFAKNNPDQELEARTSHEWIVISNPLERFPRIKSIKVNSLKSFRPKISEDKPSSEMTDKSPT